MDLFAFLVVALPCLWVGYQLRRAVDEFGHGKRDRNTRLLDTQRGGLCRFPVRVGTGPRWGAWSLSVLGLARVRDLGVGRGQGRPWWPERCSWPVVAAVTVPTAKS